jgi:hypothetical protein
MPADKLAGKRIRASLDAVVYDDGTFSGPDTLNLFAQLSSKDQQIREFLNRLADQLFLRHPRRGNRSLAGTQGGEARSAQFLRGQVCGSGDF